MDVPNAVVRRLLLTTAFVLAAPPSQAACQSEIRILADDLAGMKLNSYQMQSIADKIFLARRHCWVQHEKAALDLVNSARRIAGLRESTGEFDWENVPLESLEQQD